MKGIIWNKRTLYCSVKLQKEADAKGCERDTGGRLSRSSVEVVVITMERRARHVRFQNNLQPIKRDD